jgi:hypothetical protein
MKERQPSEVIAEGAEAGKRYLNVIEGFLGIGRQLYESTENHQPTEFLIQQASRVLISWRNPFICFRIELLPDTNAVSVAAGECCRLKSNRQIHGQFRCYY